MTTLEVESSVEVLSSESEFSVHKVNLVQIRSFQLNFTGGSLLTSLVRVMDLVVFPSFCTFAALLHHV
jgi:hypothetical protein